MHYSPPGLYYTYDFEDIGTEIGNSNYDYVNHNETFVINNNVDYLSLTMDDENVDHLSGGINDDNYSYPSLGLGDFLAFNLMSLVITNPLWPTTTKLYVFIGCVITIQIGYFITKVVQNYWQETTMPGLPIPIITFSAYAIIVDYLMYSTSAQSINIQSCA